MPPTLRYGFEDKSPDARLFLELPIDVIPRSKAYRDEIGCGPQALASQCITIEQSDESVRLYVNAPEVGNASQTSNETVRETVNLLSIVTDFANSDERDPALNVEIGTESINKTGRYAMWATVRWPELDDSLISADATLRMQHAARHLRYPGLEAEDLLDHMVYADVSRQRGVSVQTNPVGSCSLDTTGDRYEPDKPQFEIDAHNIYMAEQQLICLYGLVAIAHADELA